MAQAMQYLANTIKSTKEPGKSKVREPDTFDGSSPKKLRTFFVQCRLNFDDRPSSYPTEQSKVTFALSYLSGTALSWFEPALSRPTWAVPPPWMTSWNLFMKELERNFGPYDAEGDAEAALENLVMRDNHHVNKYIVEFYRLASEIHWDDKALCRRFYKNLPARLKNEISRVGKPRTLMGMRDLAQAIDHRYWEREDEIRQENSASRKTSSGNNSGTPNSSGNNSGNNNNSGKGKNKSSNNGNHNKPSGSNSSHNSGPPPTSNNNSGNKFNNSGNQKPSSDISSKLGKDGKLTSEERNRRIANKLCLFCGQSGHNAASCPKSTSNASKAKARGAQVTSGSDDSDSKK
jgi:hypothetical protein